MTVTDPVVALRDRWVADSSRARERGDHRSATNLANHAEALSHALGERPLVVDTIPTEGDQP